jgi:hypothetical protein
LNVKYVPSARFEQHFPMRVLLCLLRQCSVADHLKIHQPLPEPGKRQRQQRRQPAQSLKLQSFSHSQKILPSARADSVPHSDCDTGGGKK